MPIVIKELDPKTGKPKKEMPLPKRKPRHANPNHPMNAERTTGHPDGVTRKASGGGVKVKSGDTLSQIAKSNGVTLKSLMAANPGIKNANEIRVGQSIKMPTGEAKTRSQIAFQDVDKNLNRRDNVYAGMTKSSMKALADDTAAKRAKKAGKPVSKKQSETANKRARVTTRLNQLGEINKQRRAADADKKPQKAKRSRPAIPSNDIAAKKGGAMKAKGYKRGGKMCRGGGAATKGKRYGKAG